jgi:hypothetical protein
MRLFPALADRDRLHDHPHDHPQDRAAPAR